MAGKLWWNTKRKSARSGSKGAMAKFSSQLMNHITCYLIVNCSFIVVRSQNETLILQSSTENCEGGLIAN